MGEPNNKNNKLSIDRIDNRKGYSKDNCKWSTQKEQTLNQERSLVNRFSSAELTTIKEFYVLASRFKSNGVQNFNMTDLCEVLDIGTSTIPKIMNSYYINLAKEKELYAKQEAGV